jgi:hypothetical protein
MFKILTILCLIYNIYGYPFNNNVDNLYPISHNMNHLIGGYNYYYQFNIKQSFEIKIEFNNSVKLQVVNNKHILLNITTDYIDTIINATGKINIYINPIYNTIIKISNINTVITKNENDILAIIFILLIIASISFFIMIFLYKYRKIVQRRRRRKAYWKPYHFD